MEDISKKEFSSIKRPKKLSYQIEEQILNSIRQKVFAVGDLLPGENKLTDIFKVSRGVIREALQMLATKGMIEIQKGKGAIVLNPSIDTILDPFSSFIDFKCGNKGLSCSLEARIKIEPQVAALAAMNRTKDDLLKLGEFYKNMKKYKGDLEKLHFFDIEFHKSISTASANPLFAIILEPIYHFQQTYYKDVLDYIDQDNETFDYHLKILNAIEQKDSESAAQYMEKHLSVALEYIEKSLIYK